MSQKKLLYERHGAVVVLKLNNPDRLNALTMEIREEMGPIVQEISRDETIRAVLLTAVGPSFSAGGDLVAMQEDKTPLDVKRRVENGHRHQLPLLNIEKPLITAVRGWVVGAGLSLSLTGDLIIASDNTRFRTGFLGVGAVPDMAILYLLPRFVGMGRAKELLLTNRTFDAHEAKAMGLVAQVVDDDQLEEVAMDYATRLAALPTQSVGLAKSIINQSFESNLHNMLDLERFAQSIAMTTQDFREGLAAFVEKRQPVFRGY